jgi:hypothetical protein
MPAQYEAIKRSVGGDKSRAARIFISQGKTKAERSSRARSLQADRPKRTIAHGKG